MAEREISVTEFFVVITRLEQLIIYQISEAVQRCSVKKVFFLIKLQALGTGVFL